MNAKPTLKVIVGAVALGFGFLGGAGAADNAKNQEPTYHSSIKVDEQNHGEGSEAARLAHLAKITSTQAISAALAQVPGTVLKVELDNEDGNLVYSVNVKTASNEVKDVKVDAGNGQVLQVGGDEEDEDKE